MITGLKAALAILYAVFTMVLVFALVGSGFLMRDRKHVNIDSVIIIGLMAVLCWLTSYALWNR